MIGFLKKRDYITKNKGITIYNLHKFTITSMTASDKSTLSKLAQNLKMLSQKRATGEWLLNNKHCQWKLYFYQGRLFYATGDIHRFRRWERALKLHCPNFIPDTSFTDEPWEYQLLNIGVSQKQINVTQGKAIIRSAAEEVLFSLARHPMISSRWIPDQQPSRKLILSLLLPPVELEQLIEKTESLCQQWQDSGLENFSPHTAPICKQSLGEKNANLEKLLNGENTLWDIAYQLRRNITAVVTFLLPLINRGIVELKEVPDFTSPLLEKTPTRADVKEEKVQTANSDAKKLPSSDANNKQSEQSFAYQPLIACIDDSPVIMQALEKIIVPAGYRMLKIREPLREMSTLVKQKPDLIFLDLVMPDASGYSICRFLRQTPLFERTPIIILTSRDTVMNRGQAKLTGATAFLNKPPDPKKVLYVIKKYLKKEQETLVVKETKTISTESMRPSLGGT